MYCIVSLSGGVPSAIVLERAIERFGRKKVWPWFTDTSWEDEDLYRFLADLERYFQVRIRRYRDGRTPLEVAEQHRIVPNQMVAPCTYELKIKPTEEWLWRVPKPVTVALGLDWSEMHRIDKRRYWQREGGATSPAGWVLHSYPRRLRVVPPGRAAVYGQIPDVRHCRKLGNRDTQALQAGL